MSVPQNQDQILKVQNADPENQKCADCGAPDPIWASTNIGVFICVTCSGVHRSMGVHISKVLSVKLDDWADPEIENMKNNGNKKSNEKFKITTPKEPIPSDLSEREIWIRKKYNAPRVQRTQSAVSKNKTNELIEHEKQTTGILKCDVVKGTDLGAFDLCGTSDPYVRVKCGKQEFKTKKKEFTLNPVWKQHFMLNVSITASILEIELWDHDYLDSDDLMGKAEIRLCDQELVSGEPKEIIIPMPKGQLFLELTYTSLV